MVVEERVEVGRRFFFFCGVDFFSLFFCCLQLKKRFKRWAKKQRIFPLKAQQNSAKCRSHCLPSEWLFKDRPSGSSKEKVSFSGDLDGGIMAEAWHGEPGGWGEAGGWRGGLLDVFPHMTAGRGESRGANKRSGETGEAAIH